MEHSRLAKVPGREAQREPPADLQMPEEPAYAGHSTQLRELELLNFVCHRGFVAGKQQPADGS